MTFPDHFVGLALSGGGIRSATFSVGVLRSLSRLKLVPRIDYLSTVSGGGYAGAFYCSLFVPAELRGLRPSLAPAVADAASARQAGELGDDPLGSRDGRAAIDQLRQGGNYLMPAGASDTLYAFVIAVRNWLAVSLVTGIAVLACFLAINLVRIPLVPQLRDARLVLRADAVDPSPIFASYLWLLAAPLVPLWLLPCAWAFWMTRGVPQAVTPADHRENRFPTLVAIMTTVVFALLLWNDRSLRASPYARVAGLGTMASAMLGILYYRCARALVGAQDPGGAETHATAATRVARENRVRAKLGRWLYRGTVVLLCLAAAGLVDDLGRLVYFLRFEKDWPTLSTVSSAVPPGLLAAVAAARWLLTRGQASRYLTLPRLGLVLRRFGRAIAVAFALAVLLMLLTFWSAIAYEIVWHDQPVGARAPFGPWDGTTIGGLSGWPIPVVVSAFTATCAIMLGNVRSFLNHSSLAAFYAGRLRRAYLGATNKARREANSRGTDIGPDVEHPGDDIDLRAYFHASVRAPLHIINVTINETTAQSSNVIQRDRKGKSMTVSCEGYGTTRGGATEGVRTFALADGEQLPLSSWVGISGAAFSTGVGQNTSLGQSLLAAMVNMRLGYWWDALPQPKGGWARRSAADLVQTYLLREARASYEGTHTNRWYLSDGGHYENTGVYELVRRRVGLIVACDNGADPRYEFADIVNLVRKLRIDFEAETEFVGEAELDILFGGCVTLRATFGTLAQLVPGAAARGSAAGPYATLARIRYRAPADEHTQPTTLLVIKPRVSGTELPDLLRYRDANAAFPQQPTADQSFDEAQWESYFRLGELIADAIFEPRPPAPDVPAGQWWPASLTRLPPSPQGDEASATRPAPGDRPCA